MDHFRKMRGAIAAAALCGKFSKMHYYHNATCTEWQKNSTFGFDTIQNSKHNAPSIALTLPLDKDQEIASNYSTYDH